MSRESGFSLAEMVIVLVLAGIVSTAAITMFSTQNRLNAAMTALGESQENARSAVQVAAAEIRAATAGGLMQASPNVVVLRVPVVMGIVCAQSARNTSHVYFPMHGRTLDLRNEIDGSGVQDDQGDWRYGRLSNSDGFRGNASRAPCTEAGTGDLGEDSDYATLRGRRTAGAPVLLYRQVEYSFGRSGLDETRRALFRSQSGEQVELAQGFTDESRFAYRLEGDTVWRSPITTSLRGIVAVRLIAEVEGEGTSGMQSGTASFALTRDVVLRNTR